MGCGDGIKALAFWPNAAAVRVVGAVAAVSIVSLCMCVFPIQPGGTTQQHQFPIGTRGLLLPQRKLQSRMHTSASVPLCLKLLLLCRAVLGTTTLLLNTRGTLKVLHFHMKELSKDDENWHRIALICYNNA